MEVGAGRVAGGTDVADHVARVHVLVLAHREAGLVAVERRHFTAVVDDDRVAVPALRSGDDDDPRPAGVDGRAVGGLQVVTGMEPLRAADRIDPGPEAADDRTRDRSGVAMRRRPRPGAALAEQLGDRVGCRSVSYT